MREGLPSCLYGAQKGAQKLLKRCSGSRPEALCHYLSINNLKIINQLISNPSKLQFLDFAKRTIHILWNIMLLSFSLPQILRGVVWFSNAEKSGRYFFSLQIISYTVRNASLRDKSYPHQAASDCRWHRIRFYRGGIFNILQNKPAIFYARISLHLRIEAILK